MIVYPESWERIGNEIGLEEIKDAILEVLFEIKCNCLALSGGIDSSLLLHFMLEIHPKIFVFTLGISEEHPDVECAKSFAANFPNVEHHIYIPSREEIESEKQETDFPGDDAVRLFYRFVGRYVDEIIAGDGIDEFMCGYYDHQKDPCEKTYYDYMERLQSEQLAPLHKNSGCANVYLPYLDHRLLLLLSQIPIWKKVDKENRKKLMIQLAKDRLPNQIIMRRKYGFCDAFAIKGRTGDLHYE